MIIPVRCFTCGKVIGKQIPILSRTSWEREAK